MPDCNMWNLSRDVCSSVLYCDDTDFRVISNEKSEDSHNFFHNMENGWVFNMNFSRVVICLSMYIM